VNSEILGRWEEAAKVHIHALRIDDRPEM